MIKNPESLHVPWRSSLRHSKAPILHMPGAPSNLVNCLQGEIDTISDLLGSILACRCDVGGLIVVGRLQRSIEQIIIALSEAVQNTHRARQSQAAECLRVAKTLERDRELMAVLSEQNADLLIQVKNRPQKKSPCRPCSAPSGPPMSPSTVCYVSPAAEGRTVRSPKSTDGRDQNPSSIPTLRSRPCTANAERKRLLRERAFLNVLLSGLRSGSGSSIVRIHAPSDPEIWDSVREDAESLGIHNFFDGMTRDPTHTAIMISSVPYPASALRGGRCLNDRPHGLVHRLRDRTMVRVSSSGSATTAASILKGFSHDILLPFITNDVEDNPEKNFITIGFTEVLIVPSAYSVASWSPIGKGFLPRHWVLEASLNGVNPVVISDQKDDRSINKESDFGVWDISPPAQGPFNTFTLRATGRNLLGTHHLQMTAFEIYGRSLTLKMMEDDGSAAAYRAPESPPRPQNLYRDKVTCTEPPSDLPPCPPMEVEKKETKGNKKKK